MRRYNEAEVAAIFQWAAQASPQESAAAASPPESLTTGLTLAELKEIGREVGIPGEAITAAAQAVNRAEPVTSRRFLGLPLGVSHSVQLDRRLTDEEWEAAVVDLRETFEAQGKLSSHGSLRQWTNGNLQALLEPTSDGRHRIRLRTTKGDARGLLTAGLGMIAASATMLTAAGVLGALGDTGMVSAAGFLGFMGAWMFGWSAFTLPGWAKTRRRQMEEVGERTAALARAD